MLFFIVKHRHNFQSSRDTCPSTYYIQQKSQTKTIACILTTYLYIILSKKKNVYFIVYKEKGDKMSKSDTLCV